DHLTHAGAGRWHGIWDAGPRVADDEVGCPRRGGDPRDSDLVVEALVGGYQDDAQVDLWCADLGGRYGGRQQRGDGEGCRDRDSNTRPERMRAPHPSPKLTPWEGRHIPTSTSFCRPACALASPAMRADQIQARAV